MLFRAFSALVGTHGFFAFSHIFCIGVDSRIVRFFAPFQYCSGLAEFWICGLIALQSSEIFHVHVDKYGMLSHTRNLEAA